MKKQVCLHRRPDSDQQTLPCFFAIARIKNLFKRQPLQIPDEPFSGGHPANIQYIKGVKSIMENKASVVIMTLISAFLFSSLLVTASLSPLADSGPHANQFGTFGMWAAIGTVLVFYILPLIVYMIGIDAMKFVMAVFCGIGLLIIVAMIPVILLFGSFSGTQSALWGVISLCVVLTIVNVIWFFAAFRSSAKSQRADFR